MYSYPETLFTGFENCFETEAVDNFFLADRKALELVLWDGMAIGIHIL